MEIFINTLAENFDPLSTILIVVVSLLLWKSIKRLMNTVIVNTCKIQAMSEGIQKYSPNGQGAYIREREKALLEEQQIIEGK